VNFDGQPSLHRTEAGEIDRNVLPLGNRDRDRHRAPPRGLRTALPARFAEADDIKQERQRQTRHHDDAARDRTAPFSGASDDRAAENRLAHQHALSVV
jgi:hypothetical protein